VTISAHDATSGLATDPSRRNATVPTSTPGLHVASTSATDHCGNQVTTSLAYTVITNPVLSRTVDLETRSGTVTVKVPGAAPEARGSGLSQQGFVMLNGARQVPVGTIVGATTGDVAVETATAAGGRLQTGTFGGGRFQVLQPRSAHGLAELRLIDVLTRAGCAPAKHRGSKSTRRLGLLRANANGRFETIARAASATTRGRPASWTVTDRCDGTLTVVTHASVIVHDRRAAKSRLVGAGRRYFAKSG
jgi:hypothetical protein